MASSVYIFPLYLETAMMTVRMGGDFQYSSYATKMHSSQVLEATATVSHNPKVTIELLLSISCFKIPCYLSLYAMGYDILNVLWMVRVKET